MMDAADKEHLYDEAKSMEKKYDSPDYQRRLAKAILRIESKEDIF